MTNVSCGLHINISSIKKSKMKNFNPLPFISSKIWNQILKKFHRQHNHFCKLSLSQNGLYSNVTIIKKLSDAFKDKYYCVNLKNFGNGLGNASRIEIRGFGNKNYSKKFTTISVFIKRIEKLFNLSCNNKYKFLPMIKV